MSSLRKIAVWIISLNGLQSAPGGGATRNKRHDKSLRPDGDLGGKNTFGVDSPFIRLNKNNFFIENKLKNQLVWIKAIKKSSFVL